MRFWKHDNNGRNMRGSGAGSGSGGMRGMRMGGPARDVRGAMGRNGWTDRGLSPSGNKRGDGTWLSRLGRNGCMRDDGSGRNLGTGWFGRGLRGGTGWFGLAKSRRAGASGPGGAARFGGYGAGPGPRSCRRTGAQGFGGAGSPVPDGGFGQSGFGRTGGGRFRRFLGRMFGGFGQAETGRNGRGQGGPIGYEKGFGPGTGLGRGMRGVYPGREGGWRTPDQTSVDRPGDAPVRTEPGRRGGAWTNETPPDAASAAAGTCPLCDNHCPLSSPGCPKGEAYGRSLTAKADR